MKSKFANLNDLRKLILNQKFTNKNLRKFKGPIKLVVEQNEPYDWFSVTEVRNKIFTNGLTIKDLTVDKLKFINCEFKIDNETCMLENIVNSSIRHIAFVNCKINKIVIRDSFESIQDVSFCNCYIGDLNNFKKLDTLTICQSYINSFFSSKHINELEINSSIIDGFRYYSNNDVCIINSILDKFDSQCYFSQESRNAQITLKQCNFFNFFMDQYFEELPDDLTRLCMAVDAQHHTCPELFDIWAKGGECPYSENVARRVIEFEENRELWTPELKTLNVNIPSLVKKLYKTLDIELIW